MEQLDEESKYLLDHGWIKCVIRRRNSSRHVCLLLSPTGVKIRSHTQLVKYVQSNPKVQMDPYQVNLDALPALKGEPVSMNTHKLVMQLKEQGLYQGQVRSSTETVKLFSVSQLITLESHFIERNFQMPSEEEMQSFARAFNRVASDVRQWYQNRLQQSTHAAPASGDTDATMPESCGAVSMEATTAPMWLSNTNIDPSLALPFNSYEQSYLEAFFASSNSQIPPDNLLQSISCAINQPLAVVRQWFVNRMMLNFSDSEFVSKVEFFSGANGGNTDGYISNMVATQPDNSVKTDTSSLIQLYYDTIKL